MLLMGNQPTRSGAFMSSLLLYQIPCAGPYGPPYGPPIGPIRSIRSSIFPVRCRIWKRCFISWITSLNRTSRSCKFLLFLRHTYQVSLRAFIVDPWLHSHLQICSPQYTMLTKIIFVMLVRQWSNVFYHSKPDPLTALVDSILIIIF